MGEKLEKILRGVHKVTKILIPTLLSLGSILYVAGSAGSAERVKSKEYIEHTNIKKLEILKTIGVYVFYGGLAMVPPTIILGYRFRRQMPEPKFIYGRMAYRDGDRDPSTGKILKINRDGFAGWVDDEPSNYSPD